MALLKNEISPTELAFIKAKQLDDIIGFINENIHLDNQFKEVPIASRRVQLRYRMNSSDDYNSLTILGILENFFREKQ